MQVMKDQAFFIPKLHHEVTDKRNEMLAAGRVPDSTTLMVTNRLVDLLDEAVRDKGVAA